MTWESSQENKDPVRPMYFYAKFDEEWTATEKYDRSKSMEYGMCSELGEGVKPICSDSSPHPLSL